MAHIVKDHPFIPANGNYWDLCKTCHLAPSAHAESTVSLDIAATNYRCPDCVTSGINPCPHQTKREARPEPLPVAEIDLSEMQEYVIGEDSDNRT